MRKCRLITLLLLFVIVPLAQGADYPKFSAGEYDVVFQEAAPESSDRELKRRFDAKEAPPAYDVAKEKFRIVVPKSYRHDAAAWGLFVWVDASPVPNIPSDWLPVLAEKKLLVVAANNSGNARALFDRCRMAIDAAHNMKQRFHVNPGRVYVSGASGGGRVSSMLGVAYADIFSGSFPMIGVNFYKPVSTGAANKAWLPIYEPDADILAQAKSKNRYVLLTGEKDFNRENTQRVYKDGFQAEKFRNVLYLEVPDLGHSRPSAEWFVKGLGFLDSDPENRHPNQCRRDRDDSQDTPQPIDPSGLGFPLAAQGQDEPGHVHGAADRDRSCGHGVDLSGEEGEQASGAPEQPEDHRQGRHYAGLPEQGAQGGARTHQAEEDVGGSHAGEEREGDLEAVPEGVPHVVAGRGPRPVPVIALSLDETGCTRRTVL